MGQYENFLNAAPLPKWVHVSREGMQTDIAIDGHYWHTIAISIFVFLPIGIFLCFIAFVMAANNTACCGTSPTECQPCSSTELIMNYVPLLLAVIATPLLIFFHIKADSAKTIIRIDDITGNFSMFQRAFTGAQGKPMEFVKESVIPVVRSYHTHKGPTRYELQVYPDVNTFQKGAGLFTDTPDVFFVRNLAQERCEWGRELIMAIRERPLTEEEGSPEMRLINKARELLKKAQARQSSDDDHYLTE